MLILGNLIALAASMLMVYTGYLKKKKKILYLQTIQIILSSISNLVLQGFTGAIINALSCIRNILCYYNKLNLVNKLILIFLSISLSLIFNNLGIIGLLPVISIIVYTLYMDTKDIIKFKLLIIFSMIMWMIYDLYIGAYVAALFDFACIITNLISIQELNEPIKS